MATETLLKRGYSTYDLRHYKQTEAYVMQVERLYNLAVAEFSRMAVRLNADPDKPFSFKDYPVARREAVKIIQKLVTGMERTIQTGIKEQWLFANKKNDAFLESILRTSKVPKALLVKMQDRNLDALKTFQARKTAGFDISQRIWKQMEVFRQSMELALDVGIGEGRSAQQLSRDIRQNLLQPDKLFRRVRDVRGQLQLSKAAKAYHPGRGVYRSSYKNAMRLTRTEVNGAYRDADRLRWTKLDFVIGFEVKLSNNHTLNGEPFRDICFVNWNYTVLTSKGEIPISRVKINDLVLTHTGKFRKVTKVFHTPSDYEELTRISIKTAYDNRSKVKTIQSTNNHPYLVNGVWTKACDVKIGDKIRVLATQCKGCGKLIPNYRSFCSKICSSRNTANNQHANPEHAEKLRIKRKKLIAENDGIPWLKDYLASGRNVDNFTSPESQAKSKITLKKLANERAAKGEHQFQRPEVKKKAFSALGKNRKTLTLIEKRMGWLLKQIKVEYTHNYPFERDLKHPNGTPRMYFIDYVLKEHKIAIECDGEYWHQDKEKDLKRQKEIEAKGFTVLRFTGAEISNDLQGCGAEIERVLKNHKGKYEYVDVEVSNVEFTDIDKHRRKALTKYNLEVDKDNSYTVNGFVVHNCDELTGKYPKWFVYKGWHPQCRCFAIPILSDPEEFKTDELNELRAAIKGTEYKKYISKNEIKDVPEAFKRWVTQNQQRVDGYKSPPYFVKDNFKNGIIAEGLRYAGSLKASAPVKDVYSQVRVVEDRIRMNRSFETAYAVDSSGKVIINKKGQARSVSFTEEEAARLKDTIFTHNHPSGWEAAEGTMGRIGSSFSRADVELAITRDIAEIRAVTPHYTFSVKRPSGGWGISGRVARAEIIRIEESIRSDFVGRINEGTTTMNKANVMHYHRLWKEFCAKYNLEYTKARTR